MLKKFILFVMLNLFIGFGIFAFLDVVFPLPNPVELKKFSQLVVDKNGRPLRAFADENGVWRYPTDLNQVSPDYIEALINYEDRWYWQHSGVNPFALMRAVKQMLVNQKAISGGSTLTMQVARILDPHEKSVSGKIWQMFRAYQLEFHFSKTEIMNLYLNYAPFGGPLEGVEAASYTYLGKSAKYLTAGEAALLAVLPQSPSRFRPDRYPDRAEAARNKILDRLRSFGIWDKEKVEQASRELVVAEYNSQPLHAPLLARYLVNKNADRQLIRSTIDLDFQLIVADQLKEYLFRFSENTSAAAMLMDNDSLDVLAYVGAADFANEKRYGHIDMNRAIRSPGSTLKPFIYGLAMDKRFIHSESLLQDVPLNFNRYSPENFDQNYSGAVSVAEALQQSLNIPAVQVLSYLEPAYFSAKLNNAGLRLYYPDDQKPSLSIALGGVGTKLYELAGIYRALAAKGQAGRPRYQIDEPKREVYLMSEESAWVIGEVLS
ncbi:MAG: penicillin-binding protein 1C, partial [Gammaproteobacteria bacterium]|nr:penicillin-binding protein 1C [Gammaproteobacteria bacterium]